MPTKYDRTCCKLTDDEVKAKLEAGEPSVVRMKVPEGETTVIDAIRGNVTFNNAEVDDQVLLKSDGFPTYHLAVVVDDHLMNITHVIRGEEWLSSTPKHVILTNWFGFEMPMFAHLPLILNPDKSKLSKRQGDVAVEDFLQKGYLVDALKNFVALLGFNPRGDQEIYTEQELIDAFDLGKINKSGAVFDRDKLDWMNGQYIKNTPSEELSELVKPFLGDAEIEKGLLTKICEVEKQRMTVLSDITENLEMYLQDPTVGSDVITWKKSDAQDAKTQLEAVKGVIESMDEKTLASAELIEEGVKRYIVDNDLKNGNVLWPMRVALSGRERSPGPFELVWVLGREVAIARIERAINSFAS